MHALPALLALATAALLAPRLLRFLLDGSHLQTNYRERDLPYPFGLLILVSVLLALIPLSLIEQFTGSDLFYPELPAISVYILGVGLLGLIDDLFSSSARGWRGHGSVLLGGGFSTGALKAAGALGLALYVTSGRNLSTGRFFLAVGILVLATNALNLLDLRPGRATKALALLGAGLTIGVQSVRAMWALGLYWAPALVAGAYDLHERAMLGDTGSNVLGAIAGLWIVLTLSTVGQLIALAILLAMTIYGEFRSISKLIERTPLLRELDSWGRPA